MPTYSKETALYDTGAISTDITEAGQTAGRYITAIDNSGIKVHAESNPNVNYSKIDANGLEVFKGTTVSNSESVAKFGDIARIGKEDSGHVTITNNNLSVTGTDGGVGFNVNNVTATETASVSDYVVGVRNYGGTGTYNHTIIGYVSGLSAFIAFANPAGNVIPISCTKTIPLSNFGSWSINSSDTGFKATGSISFNSTTKEVALVVSTMSGVSNYRLVRYELTYTAYPQLATVSIGRNVNLSDKDIALAVGSNSGNAFAVKRNGDVMAFGNTAIGGLLDLQGFNMSYESLHQPVFVLETNQLFASTSISAGSHKYGTVNFTKSGYYPLSIAGWNAPNTVFVPSRLRLTDMAVGSVTVAYDVCNPRTSSGTSNFNVDILWVRAAA